ncbi:MAG: hypothetical protein VX012_00165, partial [Planctomycetota bacterium]|nr:hypothetical protein [Planctomycetota bacterium]
MRFTTLLLLSMTMAPAGVATATAPWPPDVPVAEMPTTRAVRAPRSVRPMPLSNGRWRTTFTIEGVPAERMRLAGSFNGWNPDAGEMRRDALGRWTIVVPLDDGTHYYKFVRDDGDWMPDPLNEERVPDGHGGENTVFAIGEDALIRPDRAVRGDGKVLGIALRHDPTDWRDLQPLPEDRFQVSVRTLRGDVERAWVVFEDGRRFTLESTGGSNRFDRWRASLPADREGLPYTFIFQDGDTRVR